MTVTLGTPNVFYETKVEALSQINGDVTDYTFTVEMYSELKTGEYLIITPPSQIDIILSSSEQLCVGIRALKAVLSCEYTNEKIQIKAEFKAYDTLPAYTEMKFTLKNLQNPISLEESDSFTVEAYTSDLSYVISRDRTGLTIRNSAANTITVASVTAESLALGNETSYEFVFVPVNAIPANGRLQVFIPEEITPTAPYTCEGMDNIEYSISCSWNSIDKSFRINNGFPRGSSVLNRL